MTAARKWLFGKWTSSEKAAALKKYLLRKSNYCVKLDDVKSCVEVASLKIKLS